MSLAMFNDRDGIGYSMAVCSIRREYNALVREWANVRGIGSWLDRALECARI